MKSFYNYLILEEKAEGTVEKYMRDVRQFLDWLGEKDITKEAMTMWRDSLAVQGLKPSTINGKLASVNCYLLWSGHPECRVKTLKLQRSVFRDQNRELNRNEYTK